MDETTIPSVDGAEPECTDAEKAAKIQPGLRSPPKLRSTQASKSAASVSSRMTKKPMRSKAGTGAAKSSVMMSVVAGTEKSGVFPPDVSQMLTDQNEDPIDPDTCGSSTVVAPTTSQSKDPITTDEAFRSAGVAFAADEEDDEDRIAAKWQGVLGNAFEIIIAPVLWIREEGGFAMTFEGTVIVEDGSEIEPHHYIRSVVTSETVGDASQFQRGDELLEVNGIDLYGLSHFEVVMVLKSLPHDVILVVARRKPTLIIHTSYYSFKSSHIRGPSSLVLRKRKFEEGLEGESSVEHGAIKKRNIGVVTPPPDKSESTDEDGLSMIMASTSSSDPPTLPVEEVSVSKGGRGLSLTEWTESRGKQPMKVKGSSFVGRLSDEDISEGDSLPLAVASTSASASSPSLSNKLVTIDTNLLIDLPTKWILDELHQIYGTKYKLVIPWMALQELNSIKSRAKKEESVKMGARAADKFINALVEGGNQSVVVEDPRFTSQSIEIYCNDDHLLNCCLEFKERYENVEVVMFSWDTNIRTKSVAVGLKLFDALDKRIEEDFGLVRGADNPSPSVVQRSSTSKPASKMSKARTKQQAATATKSASTPAKSASTTAKSASTTAKSASTSVKPAKPSAISSPTAKSSKAKLRKKVDALTK